MTSAELYRWLMSGSSSAVCEQFDAHVVACVLSIALAQAELGTSLVETLGLEARQLSEFALSIFPHASAELERMQVHGAPTTGEDERRVRELLVRNATERSRFQEGLSAILARKATRSSELWQELGLRNARELAWLMSRHFEPLAARNVHDVPWNAFLYQSIERGPTASS